MASDSQPNVQLRSQHSIIGAMCQRDPGETSRPPSLARRGSRRSYIPSSLSYPSPPSSNEDEITAGKAQPKSKACYSSAHIPSRPQFDDSESTPRSNSNRDYVDAVMRLLAHERARADLAEKQLARDNEVIVTRLRKMHETHMRTEAELIRAKTELSMYKYQLDLAHKEIQRAQVIIDDVERARAEAEERSIKDREENRKLVLQRAINEAREESKQEGWKLGLERGRRHVLAMQREEIRQRHSLQLSPALHRQVHNTFFSTSSPTFSILFRDAQVASIPPNMPSSPTNNDPDNAHENAPHYSQRAKSIHALSRGRPRSPRSRSRPRTRSSSLAPSRHSIKSHASVPPDGFIPTLGSNDHISLPPPHGLSTPVDIIETAVAKSQRPSGPQSGVVGSSKLRGDSAEKNTGRDAFDGDDESRKNKAFFSHPHGDSRRRNREEAETPLSAASRASTRISEFDIVAPPPNQISQAKRERLEEKQIFHYPQLGVNHNAPITEPIRPQRVEEADHNQVHTEALRTRVSEAPVSNGIQTFDPNVRHDLSRARQPHQSPLLSKFYRTASLGPDSRDSPGPRRTVERSTSNVTVPGIDVQPPSHSPTNTSPGTVLDPVLLTPDHAYHPLPGSTHKSQAESSTYQHHDPLIVNQFPPGFIPLSSLSTIPVTDQKLGSVDTHSKLQEQGFRPRHQIYSGIPQKSDIPYGVPSSNSVLFGLGDTRDKLHERDFSPAPLNRPFSVFSDD